MGNDESHSDVSFNGCEGQSHKTVSTYHNLSREMTAEAESSRGPSSYKPKVLPLDQPGSPFYTSLIPYDKFGSHYLGKATTTARTAALPNRSSVCSSFVCANNGMAASVFDF